MIAKLIDELALNPPPEIKAIFELLGRTIQDQPYRDLVQELKMFPNFEKRERLLNSGNFNGQDFIQLVHACGDGKGTSIQVITSFLQRLNEWGLVLDHGLLGGNLLVRYQ